MVAFDDDVLIRGRIYLYVLLFVLIFFFRFNNVASQDSSFLYEELTILEILGTLA